MKKKLAMQSCREFAKKYSYGVDIIIAISHKNLLILIVSRIKAEDLEIPHTVSTLHRPMIGYAEFFVYKAVCFISKISPHGNL